MSCTIVIPVYKQTLSGIEEQSLKQCLNVLSKHDIALVGPNSLEYTYYKQVAKETGKQLRIERYDDEFFKSVQAYNALCLNEDFYKRFSDYDFMLIYQTDAWVFRDELDYWCQQGYDYIGAPHFVRRDGMFTQKFFGCGNGGFSLRKVSYCLDILTTKWRRAPYLTPRGIVKHISLSPQGFLKDVISFCRKSLGFTNCIDYYTTKLPINEDLIFGTLATNSWISNANIPDCETAAHFAFEAQPQYLYNLIGHKLPFGCHAFEKFEFQSFWTKHINV